MNRQMEKTVITIETRQRTSIRKQRRRAITARCGLCAADVLMITPDKAAELRGTTSRTIYRLIESGDLHFTETENGSLLICGDSLSTENKKH